MREWWEQEHVFGYGLFAGLAFIPRFDFVARWSVALVGTWLQFAPLIFWAPTAAAYANDTIVGALVIAFAMVPALSAQALAPAANIVIASAIAKAVRIVAPCISCRAG